MEWDCDPCQQLASALRETTERFDTSVFAVVDESERDEHWDLGPAVEVVYQDEKQVSTTFQNIATPQAFAVDRNSKVVGKRIANSSSALQQLADSLERA